MSIKHLLGFEPLPVPPHVFLVGPEVVTYARLERQASGFVLAEHRAEVLPSGTFQRGLLGGVMREPEVLDQALERLLAGVDQEVGDASLVVPDGWLRTTFTEGGDLPEKPAEREDVLRWKLKRVVPFRVDELRIDAVELGPGSVPSPEGEQRVERRLLLGFGLEALLAQLESAFARVDIRIGQLTSASLAVLAGVVAGTAEVTETLSALALVEDGGYTLTFARGAEPVLHRHKPGGGEVSATSRASFVRRDLALTRNFLGEQFPGLELERVLIAAPPQLEPSWLEWVGAELGGHIETLSGEHLPMAPEASYPTVPWRELAPLVGAATREVK